MHRTGNEYDVECLSIDKFLADIEAVCRKHGLSIGYEDGHGGFLIQPMSEHNIEWLKAAADARSPDLWCNK